MSLSILMLLGVITIGAPPLVHSALAHRAAPAQAEPATLTPQERDALVDLLTKTKEDFIQSIKGVSQAQWDFKPSPFSWSVGQTAEHIILAEDYLFNASQRLLKTPVSSRTGASESDVDKVLLARVADRSQRIMNPAAITPRGKFKTPDDAIAAFTVVRDHSIEYARTTHDDLRHHLNSANGSGGQLDAYELLLLMAGHSGRHTAQIKEIQSNPKYPSASGG